MSSIVFRRQKGFVGATSLALTYAEIVDNFLKLLSASISFFFYSLNV